MFGLGLIRFVPRRLRPPIQATVERIRPKVIALRLRNERRRPPGCFPADSRVVIVGLFSSPTGIGQGARLMWQDFRARGRDVTAIDVTRECGIPGGARPDGVHGLEALGNAPVPIIVHLNPPLYAEVYLRLSRELRRRSRMIAYWAWELEIAPPDWRADLPAVDEIWVPSRFVAGAMAGLLGRGDHRRITVVPHAVMAAPFGPRKSRTDVVRARERHGLPADALIAACSFAMGSNYARKNPMGAIAAFQRAFPDRAQDTRLILRCGDLETWPTGASELARAVRDDPRILLFDGARRSIPIGELYVVSDVYLSLHRSEGYGLNLAEAASVGTRVLATGWGLAEDIAALAEVETVEARLVPVVDPQGAYTGLGARWAEPDIADAAGKLRALAT